MGDKGRRDVRKAINCGGTSEEDALEEAFECISNAVSQMQGTMSSMQQQMEKTDEAILGMAKGLNLQGQIVQTMARRMNMLERRMNSYVEREVGSSGSCTKAYNIADLNVADTNSPCVCDMSKLSHKSAASLCVGASGGCGGVVVGGGGGIVHVADLVMTQKFCGPLSAQRTCREVNDDSRDYKTSSTDTFNIVKSESCSDTSYSAPFSSPPCPSTMPPSLSPSAGASTNRVSGDSTSFSKDS